MLLLSKTYAIILSIFKILKTHIFIRVINMIKIKIKIFIIMYIDF